MKHKRQWEQALKGFPDDAPADRIESTARDLEGMSYEPVLLLHAPNFLRMGRHDLRLEIERVADLPPEGMMAEGFGANANFSLFKAKHVQLLIYHYGLLCRLRAADPTAWDIVNELYEAD